MAPHDDWVLCGVVMGVYGVQGWVRIRSDTKPLLALADYRPWQLTDRDGGRELEPTAVKAHGKGLIAKFAGVDDRDAAAALVGCEIGVPRQALPAPGDDEFYWYDLIGLEVVTITGRRLGTVERLMETGAHDVLVVQGGGGDVLVPFVMYETVIDVRVADGRIVVDWDWD